MLNPNLRLRRAARLIVLDPELRALMFRYDVPGRPPFWVTAGGECEADESFEDAAVRLFANCLLSSCSPTYSQMSEPACKSLPARTPNPLPPSV